MTGASFISDDLVDDRFLSNRAYIAGWYKFNYKVDKCELPFCINFCFGDREFFCGRLWQTWAQSGLISQTFLILSLYMGQDNALTQSISHNFEAQPCISAIENIVFRNFVRRCLIPVTKCEILHLDNFGWLLANLIFVISFTLAGFSKTKFYTPKNV